MSHSSQQIEQSNKNNLYTSKFELGLIEKSNELLINNLIGNNVLEFGCGIGLTTSKLLESNSLVTCVEHSEHFISIAKDEIHNSDKVKFISSNWENFESSEEYTDIVIFRGLDCVEDVELILNKIKSLSTSNTRIHIVVTNTESFHRVLANQLSIDKTNSITNHAETVGRKQALNYKVMMDYFDKMNFNVEKFDGVGFKMFPNSEMDGLSEERIAAFLDLGNVNPKLAFELYFMAKCI